MKRNAITVRIPSVVLHNQFLSVTLAFELSNPVPAEVQKQISISYLFFFYNTNKEVRWEQGSVAGKVSIPRGEEPSRVGKSFFIFSKDSNVRIGIQDSDLPRNYSQSAKGIPEVAFGPVQPARTAVCASAEFRTLGRGQCLAGTGNRVSSF
jgi:hypothetical protein